MSNMKELEELDVSASMSKTISVLWSALAEVENALANGHEGEAKALLDIVVKKVMETEEYFWRPVDSDEIYDKLKAIYQKLGNETMANEWGKRINLRKAREIEFLGRVQNFCGNNTLALEYYTQAVALAPEFQLAQDGKKKAEKSVMKAKREMDTLLLRTSGNTDTLMKIGILLLNLNKVDEAIQHFKSVLAQGENLEATTRLGLAYLSAGKYEEAKKCFEKVLAEKPSSLNAKRGKNYANYFLGIESAVE
ncbi:MAG: tetratricopeptide repeat protein [Thermoplasmata archaeon]